MDDLKTMHYYSQRDVEWKNSKVTRRVAIAGVLDGNTLSLGKAECSEKDTYDKKLGRIIAIGRAKTKPFKVINLEEEQYVGKKYTDIFVSICKKDK
jgi:hypothetical protein